MRVQSTVQVNNHDMAALRINLVAEVNNAIHSIGDVPPGNLQEILKLLRRCFTCHDNPSRNTQANRQFQRRLEEMLDQDRTYKADPSVERYLYHLTMLIAEWERDHQKEILRTNGSSSHVVPTNKQGGKSQTTSSDTIDGAIQCEGCGRKGHLRSNCIYKTHPDFNHTGVWKDCKAFREVQEFFLRKGRKMDFPFYPKTKRSNGSDEQPAAVPTPQPRCGANRWKNNTGNKCYLRMHLFHQI
jgi:hypothetical protein